MPRFLSERMTMLAITACFSIVTFLAVAFYSSGSSLEHMNHLFDRSGEIHYRLSRKLLHQVKTNNSNTNPNRIGDECSPDDLVIYQAATTPLPNGIPTYTVQIFNECSNCEDCMIGHIHLSCGWFSSARLVNPHLFRRVGYNDCLVNDGQPIRNGESVSFQYANSFHYPLSVASATCISTSSLPAP